MGVKVQLGSFMLLAQQLKQKSDMLRARIGFAVADYWQEQVMNTGRLSDRGKARYLSAIEVYKDPEKTGAYLSDFVANLLETGWKRFDMKPGLLKGRKSRVIPIKQLGGNTVLRTVSDKSNGWIHPGYSGAHLAHRVTRAVPDIIKDLIKRSTR